MDVNDEYYWTEYFPALADKLREYKDHDGDLVQIMKRARRSVGKDLIANGTFNPEPMDIDPFSFFSQALTLEKNRARVFLSVGADLSLEMTPPELFPGVQSVMGLAVWQFGGGREKYTDDVKDLWELYLVALDLADGSDNQMVRSTFERQYELVLSHDEAGSPTITRGLFWFRPNYFLPLDNNFDSPDSVFRREPSYGIDDKEVKLAERSGAAYLELCDKVRKNIQSGQIPFSDIPHLSFWAYDSKPKDEKKSSRHSNPHVLLADGEEKIMNASRGHKLNTILYGPPGTGKTYETTRMALEIIDGKVIEGPLTDISFKRYKDLVKEGRIGFVTFHQSFSYEDFVEGLRPVTSDDESEDSSDASGVIRYDRVDGVFKVFCERAYNASATEGLGLAPDACVWKVSLNGTGRNPIRTDCLDNDRIRIGFDDLKMEDGTIPEGIGHTVVNAFWNRMSVGDVVCSCWSEDEVDAIGIVKSKARYDETLGSFRHVRDVNWMRIYKGQDKLYLRDLNGGKRMTLSSVYELSNVQPRDLFDAAGIDPAGVAPTEDLPYVFIIDEINRGNVSAILGELITLLEEDKRLGASQERTVKLPYSRAPWGVPGNVYIIATMNTADRSLTQLDTALRRRFSFREMAPDSSVITGREDKGIVEGVNLASLLDEMNKRIRALYDKDHAIGHSVLLGVENLDDLRDAFVEGVIPLLEEYFFDDPVKMRIVLNDSDGDFIAIDEQPSAESLGLSGFNDVDLGAETTPSFEVKRKESWGPETFKKIYRDPSAES